MIIPDYPRAGKIIFRKKFEYIEFELYFVFIMAIINLKKILPAAGSDKIIGIYHTDFNLLDVERFDAVIYPENTFYFIFYCRHNSCL